MGKNLSFLLLFFSLVMGQSCISTNSSLSSGDFSASEGDILEDPDFIIEDDNEIILNDSSHQQNEDAQLMSAVLEDRVHDEQPNLHKVVISNKLLEYQTKKGETLMLIAFNLYGDYRKWRELYALNKDVLGGSYDLSQRPILKYHKSLTPYIPPMGNPYLIKRGDTLGLISKKVYGNWQQWPIIYKNNSHQILDPDLIFAGFILYYPSLNKMALY